MTRARGNLRGLVRLRTVRERDSRIGLATALGEEREAAANVADLQHRLATLPEPATTELTAFQGRQQALELIRLALVTGRVQLETAQQVAVAARDHWISDRNRLAAVESLVERRKAALLAERQRREVRQLDEVAEQGWMLRRAVPAGLNNEGGAA